MFATVPEIVTFTSASFASTFCMFAETAVPSTTAPKLSVIPPAEKSTVAAFVASAIAAPDAAVAVSFTVMVSAFVAFDAASDVKPSRSAELPFTVAVTVPVVAASNAFMSVTASASIASGASVSVTATFPARATIAFISATSVPAPPPVTKLENASLSACEKLTDPVVAALIVAP